MSAITIRLAEDTDGHAIGDLIASVFAEYPGCLFDWSEFPELLAPAAHFRAAGGALWVAREGRDLVGTFGLKATRVPGLFELAKVYVRADRRGQGLADRMMASALDEARARGATRLMLFTDTRFRAGHRFYEKNGFVRAPGERYLADISDSWEFWYTREM
jgi:putative acetyltransferase